jgi:hypothetical protein
MKPATVRTVFIRLAGDVVTGLEFALANAIFFRSVPTTGLLVLIGFYIEHETWEFI